MTEPSGIEGFVQRVIGVIAREMDLDPEGITVASRVIEDLGAGSLNLIEIVFALEGEFGVELPTESGLPVKTVADVVGLVRDSVRG